MGNTNGKTLRDSNGRPPQALTSMPANTRGGMMGTLNAVHSDQVEVPPTPTSIIDATGKAGPPKKRELAISAYTHLQQPNLIEWNSINAIVSRGLIDRLRIQFDAPEIKGFNPKITRLLSCCERIQSLDIFCDQLPRVVALPCFVQPSVLDALPASCAALSTFHLATSLHQTVHFDVIGKIMIRAPNLRSLKLEGPNVAPSKHTDYGDYIPCHLQFLILCHVKIKLATVTDILCRSGRTLKSLHLEHVTSLEVMGISTIVGRMLHMLQYLTVIVPDASALEKSNVELSGMLDHVFAQPLPMLQYLYTSGISVSDVSFERTENSVGKIASILPSCQQLCLHNCGRVSMSTIAKAMALRRFPSLVRIEAIWPPQNVHPSEYEALREACRLRNVDMSDGMIAHYQPLVTPVTPPGCMPTDECAPTVQTSIRVDSAPFVGESSYPTTPVYVGEDDFRLLRQAEYDTSRSRSANTAVPYMKTDEKAARNHRDSGFINSDSGKSGKSVRSSRNPFDEASRVSEHRSSKRTSSGSSKSAVRRVERPQRSRRYHSNRRARHGSDSDSDTCYSSSSSSSSTSDSEEEHGITARVKGRGTVKEGKASRSYRGPSASVRR